MQYRTGSRAESRSFRALQMIIRFTRNDGTTKRFARHFVIIEIRVS